MTGLQFGQVSRIYFKTDARTQVRDKERLLNAIQQICNDGARRTSSLFSTCFTEENNAVSTCETGRCGLSPKAKHTFYFVENGSNDTDGDDFSTRAHVNNVQWVMTYRENGNTFTPQNRKAIASQKKALYDEYAAKATHRMNITLHADGTYTRGEATPLANTAEAVIRKPHF